MVFIVAGTDNYSATSKTPFAIGFITAILFAYFTLAGTHDYLAWNRAKWQTLNHLTIDQNISPHVIDGGFEFNGWNIDPSYPEKYTRQWWVYQDDYIIAFGDIEGYKKISEHPYQKWLPFGNNKIFVLKKLSF